MNQGDLSIEILNGLTVNRLVYLSIDEAEYCAQFRNKIRNEIKINREKVREHESLRRLRAFILA